MGAVVADTHAMVWYLFSPGRLSARARSALEEAVQGGDPIYIASISLVEIRYLADKGRLSGDLPQQLDRELDDPSSALMIVPLDRAVAGALARVSRDAVPDMPDRIIAATALHLNVPLVTRDGMIRAAPITTIW